MPTRCQIGFYEDDAILTDWVALIYRHYDGMPEAVIGDLAVIKY